MTELDKLKSILTSIDKKVLAVLLVLSVILSFIETIGISAIMPFISIASNPELVHENEYYNLVFEWFNFDSPNQFILLFGIVLISFYFVRAVYYIYYTYKLNEFVFKKYHHLAYKLLETYIRMPYKSFTNKNTSDLTKVIVTEALHLTAYIQNFLLLFAEVFIVILLYLMLLIVDYKMTLILTLVMLIKVVFLTKTVTKYIKVEGTKRSEYQTKFYKLMGQILSNFKFIKLKCNEDELFSDFSKASQGIAGTNIKNETLSVLPKSFLETFGFIVLIAIVIYVLIVENDASKVLPLITMYALALYRMLPALNRIMQNYNRMVYLSKSLDIVYDELSTPVEFEGKGDVKFNNEITLKDIDFSYKKNKKILDSFNLTIQKGEKVGFVGESGVGKSTLIDIIIGIYSPTSGKLMVDNQEITSNNVRAWKKKVGYIPQSIYLFDGNIADNVCFGDLYDEQRVKEVLEKVKILDYLERNADGIETKVGDGGVKLSGGQKQRIGIARALYSNPDILVLDEATSALDTDTEVKIMDEIYDLTKGKTLLVIAHRVSTLNHCDRIIDMNKIALGK